MKIGKSLVQATKGIDQSFMVQAEEMKNGGMQIMNVNGFFGNLEAELVGCPVGQARFEAASGHLMVKASLW